MTDTDTNLAASSEDAVVVTKDGLEKLENELDNLQNVRRKEVASRLKEAISYGDLSENSEYEEAKNEQAFVEGRIIELEYMIRNAKVVDEKHHSKKLIEIGTHVVVKSSAKKEELKITIVGSTEADPFNDRISNESPVGQALMGSKKGDKVVVVAPGGKTTYEVIKLS
ncbi:MAG: transcription elongation factor GreA [Oceanicoccus sp.]|jgi:transcription elongation factor GreA